MSDKEETLTIEQFKAWLEGVEEMQDDDWTPSPAQWSKVRAKIATLCEQMEKNQLAPPTHQSWSAPHGVRAGGNVPFPPHNPSPMDGIQPSDVTQQSSLDSATPQRATPAPRRPPLSASDGVQIKTPNIDTSNSDYESSFE